MNIKSSKRRSKSIFLSISYLRSLSTFNLRFAQYQPKNDNIFVLNKQPHLTYYRVQLVHMKPPPPTSWGSKSIGGKISSEDSPDSNIHRYKLNYNNYYHNYFYLNYQYIEIFLTNSRTILITMGGVLLDF